MGWKHLSVDSKATVLTIGSVMLISVAFVYPKVAFYILMVFLAILMLVGSVLITWLFFWMILNDQN